MIPSPIKDFGRIVSVPFVEMSRNFLIWCEQITSQVNSSTIQQGMGSPEGVLSADVGTLYMDTNGSSGAILYVKRDASIAGDTKQGWILV